MENNDENKRSITEKEKNISLFSLKTLESQEINDSPLLSVDIKIKENDIKKIEINSVNEIEDKINHFCKENNIQMNAKKLIQNVIIQELNKKILECKSYII